MTAAAGSPTNARLSVPVLSIPSILLVALIAVGAVAFYLGGPPGADVAGLITENELILAGQRLYVDILESNPPMAPFLYMPAVLLARLLGIAPETVVVVYAIGFGLVTSGISARAIAAAGLMKRPDLLWPVLFLLAVAGWGEHFAQREHFAAMALLPVLATAALRAKDMKPGAPLWIAAGLCGGLILAIKPHFALAILLPALYAVWRRRDPRALFLPEYFVAGGLLLGFLAMIGIVFPEYFTTVLPVANASYASDRRSLLQLARTPIAVLFEAMLVLAVLAYHRRIAANPVLGTMFWGALGFWLSYLLQGRGFTYHLMPAATLMGSVLILSFTEGTDGSARRLDAVLAVGAAGLMASVSLIDNVNQWRLGAPLIEAVAPYGPGLTIANLSPDLRAVSPLGRMVGGTVVAPGALLMSLSAERLKKDLQPTGAALAQIEAAEAVERSSLRDNMRKSPPDIIVTTGEGFDWLAWARRDPELAGLLEGYERFAEVPFDDGTLVLLKRRGLLPQG
jgi:hypothetical protein